MLSMEWSREIVSWTTTITKDTTIKLPGYKTITNGHLWYGKCSSQFLSVVLYFIDSRSNCCFATSGVACALLYVVIWKKLILLFIKNWTMIEEYAFVWLWNGSGEENSEPRFWKCFYWNVCNILLWISDGLLNLLLDGSLFSDPSFFDSSLWLLQCLVLQAARGKEMQWEACIKKETAE